MDTQDFEIEDWKPELAISDSTYDKMPFQCSNELDFCKEIKQEIPDEEFSKEIRNKPIL